ncbi:MAG: T9SS type A sorting domain-containing protein [Candidatus Cloacimonadota bacterium]|nr:T9SS type A sorting domain-containing protein [Candidatus Cloacimonadota bacterium]
MKKTLTIVLIAMLTISLFADIQQKSSREVTPLQTEMVKQSATRSINNNPPEWVMETEPVDLAANYYDYMPGSYNQTPVKVQPEQGGVYMLYHARDLAGSTRRIWSSYVDASGNVTAAGTNASTYDMHEGYPGMDIDPTTGDPFVAWHVNFDDDVEFEDAMAFDQYHIIQGPSLWATAEVIWDNSDCADVPTANPDTDDYIWPQIELTESPIDGMTTRAWALFNNSGGAGENPASNVVFGYADFNSASLMLVGELTWTWSTIPELDEMDAAGDDWDRAFLSFIASEDGQKVALTGHTLGKSGETAGAFVFLNTNYGEGEFTYHHTADIPVEDGSAEFVWSVENPMNEFDNTTDSVPWDNLLINFTHAGHFSANFTNNDTEVLFVTNVSLNTPNDSAGDSFYYPNFISSKAFIFDIETEQFKLKDIMPIRYDEDGTTLLPNNTNNTPNTWWDIDEDGEIDGTWEDSEGNLRPELVSDYAIYHPNTDNAFHYNNTKVAINQEYNLVAAVWSDGTMAKAADNSPDDPDLQQWATAPEIAIAVSHDNGNSWSEPIKMNANPEDVSSDTYTGGYLEVLDEMIPSFVYPSATIEDIEVTGDGDDEIIWGTVHLMFLDDYVYGSEIIDSAPVQGGMMKYMSVRINFSDYTGTEGGDVAEVPVRTLTNYPNPFNPTTTINYSTVTDGNVKVAVYNLKGQLVKTLVDMHQVADNHSVTWNGNDDNGNKVASGVYFYKLITKNNIEIQRMLMVK